VSHPASAGVIKGTLLLMGCKADSRAIVPAPLGCCPHHEYNSTCPIWAWRPLCKLLHLL
jgi:hypothetical protein